MNAANHTPDLNSAAGCRALALAFRDPGDPNPVLAQIAELDWMAEEWLIEHPRPNAVQVPSLGRIAALLRLFRPNAVDRPISPRPRQKRKFRRFRKARSSALIRGCLIAPLAAALCLGQTGEPVLDSKAQTLSQKSLDEADNTLTLSSFVQYAAAGCQAGAGFSGFTWDSTDAPSAVNCIDGTNVDSGSVSFADAATDRVHGSFWLPADWTGAIDISGVWRSATASTNTVRFTIETRCVADAEVIEGSWNTAQNIDDAGKGTTLQSNAFSLTSITTTGCAANEVFFWRFSRLGSDGSDTFAGSADLMRLRFQIRRTQ